VKTDSNYDYKLRSVWETGAVAYLETHSSMFMEDVGIATKTLGIVANASLEVRTEDSPNTEWNS